MHELSVLTARLVHSLMELRITTTNVSDNDTC